MKFPVAENFRVGPLESDCLFLSLDYITLGELISCAVPRPLHLENGGDEDAGVAEDSLGLICKMLRTEIGTQ